MYRVAHNVAASYVMRERRALLHLVSLEELEMLSDKAEGQVAANRRINLERLSALIQQLKPIDRQVIISYLEDMDATSIAEITGLSPAAVAMRNSPHQERPGKTISGRRRQRCQMISPTITPKEFGKTSQWRHRE